MDIKLCDECNINPANIHLTQIVQNEVIVQHLCEECAKNRGISIIVENGHISLPKTEKKQKLKHKTNVNYQKGITCPVCQMTFAEFKEKGRLGCSNCYTSFEKEIDTLLIQVHGASQHRGKRYHKYHQSIDKVDDIESLRSELDNAIRNEKFELAALIRDKINSISMQKSIDKAQD